MKIHQMPMGARFELDGEEYVKTGPLFATGKAGQRLIPKYAVLTPLGGTPAPAPRPQAGALPRARVMAALDAFCGRCAALVPEDRRSEFAAARTACIDALDAD